jgi:predicted Zn-dependent protease
MLNLMFQHLIKPLRWTEALTIIGTTAGKEYGSSELTQLVSIFEGSIDDVFKTLVVNGYRQSQEYSADETALSYLAKAGYSSKALKHFLERMATLGKESGGGILKTHPDTPDRIENVKQKTPKVKVPEDFIKLRTSRYEKVLSACQSKGIPF